MRIFVTTIMLCLVWVNSPTMGNSHSQDKEMGFDLPFSLDLPTHLLPDSLQGDSVTGVVWITMEIDSSAAIHSYVIRRIKYADTRHHMAIDFRDGEEKDKKKIEIFRPWLDDYIKKIKISKNQKVLNSLRAKAYTIPLRISINRD